MGLGRAAAESHRTRLLAVSRGDRSICAHLDIITFTLPASSHRSTASWRWVYDFERQLCFLALLIPRVFLFFRPATYQGFRVKRLLRPVQFGVRDPGSFVSLSRPGLGGEEGWRWGLTTTVIILVVVIEVVMRYFPPYTGQYLRRLRRMSLWLGEWSLSLIRMGVARDTRQTRVGWLGSIDMWMRTCGYHTNQDRWAPASLHAETTRSWPRRPLHFSEPSTPLPSATNRWLALRTRLLPGVLSCFICLRSERDSVDGDERHI